MSNEIAVFRLKFLCGNVTRGEIVLFIEFVNLLIEAAPLGVNQNIKDRISSIISQMEYVLWTSAFPDASKKMFQEMMKNFPHASPDVSMKMFQKIIEQFIRKL